MDTPYTYLFIRTDLSAPKQIVQASHAAHNAGTRFGDHSHMVLSGAKDERQLLKIAEYLDGREIDYEIFHEPDYDTGYTAICTRPLKGEERSAMKRFSLLREPEAVV